MQVKNHHKILDGEKDRIILKVSMNKEEIEMLGLDMAAMHQTKDSTALKQLWRIGRNVLHGTPQGYTAIQILENLRRNDRQGIIDAKTEIDANVATKKAQMWPQTENTP